MGAPHLARFSRDVGCHRCDPLSFGVRCAIQVSVRGIPHLATNERDVGHPGFVRGGESAELFSKQPDLRPWTGAPCSPERTWAEKTGRSPIERFCYAGKKNAPRARIVAHGVKAFEKSVFGPCTLGRTWGTRPEPLTVVRREDPPAYGYRSAFSLISKYRFRTKEVISSG